LGFNPSEGSAGRSGVSRSGRNGQAGLVSPVWAARLGEGKPRNQTRGRSPRVKKPKKMNMKKRKEKQSGASETQDRQGEGTVPALPRSSGERESCYGLSVSLTASEADKMAIAVGSHKKRSDQEHFEECSKRRDKLNEKKWCLHKEEMAMSHQERKERQESLDRKKAEIKTEEERLKREIEEELSKLREKVSWTMRKEREKIVREERERSRSRSRERRAEEESLGATAQEESMDSSESEEEGKEEPYGKPIRRIREATESETIIIKQTLTEDSKEIEEDVGSYAFRWVERLTAALTNPEGNRDMDEMMAVTVGNVIRDLCDGMQRRYETDRTICLWKLEENKYKGINKVDQKHQSVQVTFDSVRSSRETGTQTQMHEDMEVVLEERRTSPETTEATTEKLEEKMERAFLKALKRIEDEKEKSEEGGPRWTTILGRKSKKKDKFQSVSNSGSNLEEVGKEGGNRKEDHGPAQISESRNAEEDGMAEDTRRKRKNTKSFQALTKRMPKGAGIILELQGAGQQTMRKLSRNAKEEYR